MNINRACQTCHKWPEEELKARVETIQERTFKLRNVAMDALMDLISDLKAAKAAAKTDSQLATAQNFQRKRADTDASCRIFGLLGGYGHAGRNNRCCGKTAAAKSSGNAQEG